MKPLNYTLIHLSQTALIVAVLALSSSLCISKPLETAYVEFLNNNLTIQQSFLKTQQLEKRTNQATAGFLPQLDLSISREHNDLKGSKQSSSSYDFNTDLYSSPTNFRQAHLTLTQQLFDITLYDQISINNMRVHQSKLETYQLIQESSVQFVKTFYAVAKNKYFKRMLKKQREQYRVFLTELESKKLLKLMTFEDTFKIKSDYIDIIDQEMTASKELELAIIDYHHLINLPIDNQLVLDVPKLNIAEIQEVNSVEGLDHAYFHRADLRLLEYQIKLLQKQQGADQKLFKPNVSFTTKYGVTKANSFEFDRHDDRDFYWSLNAKIPLFDGFKSHQLSQEYELAIEEKLMAIESLRNTIRRDIIAAMHDVNIARQRFLNNVELTSFEEERLRSLKVKQKVKQAVESDIKMARIKLRQAQVEERVAAINLMEAITVYHLKIGKILFNMQDYDA
ncbi:MAG: TolC family protein [Candidatus Margulisiibacteriota bacterium]